MAEKLEFDLVTKQNTLTKTLDDATKKAFSLEGALTTALGVFGGGVALKGFTALGDALSATIGFAKDAVKAAALEEESQKRLAQALRATGDASKTSLDDLIAFSTELGNSTKLSGEAVTGQLAYAKSLGLSNTQSKNLVKAASELTAVFGGSLETNVQKLGLTLNGTSGKIGLQVRELQNLTEEQLRAGAAFDVINSKFSGSAQSELDSYSGRVKSLGDSYDDLVKQIGGIVINSSILEEGQRVLVGIFRDLTTAVSDYRIEVARGENGFRESQESVNQLSREYEELTSKIEGLQAKGDALPGGLDSLDASKLTIYTREVAALEKQINDALVDANAASRQLGGGEGSTPPAVVDQDEINRKKVLNAELLALDQQYELDRQIIEEQARIAKGEQAVEDQAVGIERQLEFGLQQNQIALDLEIAKTEAIKDEEERRIAIAKALRNKDLADQKVVGKAEVDFAKAATSEKIANLQRVSEVAGQLSTFANAALKDGSKEAFLISKLAAIAQIEVARATGVANALLIPDPTPTRSIQTAAIVRANTTAAFAAATVAASAIKGFADGGIIGATQGPDNTLATVRTGEMVLNADQQGNLFNMIKSGGAGGDIVINIDGREVFRAVRDQIKAGNKLPREAIA